MSFFFFFRALAFTILQTNATLLNLTQRMQASNSEFSLISWISAKHYPVPTQCLTQGGNSGRVSWRALANVTMLLSVLWTCAHSLVHSLFQLCSGVIRFFSGVQSPSSRDNIWRVMGAKEGVSADTKAVLLTYCIPGASAAPHSGSNGGHGRLRLSIKCQAFF